MENDNSVCFVLWFNIAKGFKAWPKDQNCVHNFFVYIFPIYHRVQGWRRGVGLKTWQNRGCCSYIGVFWSAMVIFHARKFTWFCTMYIDRSTHRILDNIDDNDKTGLSYSYGGVAYKEEHRPPGGGERLTLVTVRCTLSCYQKANEIQFKMQY